MPRCGRGSRPASFAIAILALFCSLSRKQYRKVKCANSKKRTLTNKHRVNGRVAEWLKAPDSKFTNALLLPLATFDFASVFRGFLTFGLGRVLPFLAPKPQVVSDCSIRFRDRPSDGF